MKGVRRLDAAPRQAWAVKLKAGKLTGIAGAGVVLGRDWLFEGGWAFTDTPRSLSLSGVYLGSGAVWDGKTLSLIGPSHTADGVFVLERPGELFASNSLPFLLASAGSFDFPIHRVGSALLSLKRGLTHYRRRIYSGRQGTVYRFLNAIVDYSPDKGVQERQQRIDPGFATFEEYRAYLVSVIRQVGQTYGSRGAAVYVSRGYDSVACAALAAEIDRNAVALCIDRSRWGVPDDGSQIAEALNLKPTLLARRERAKILRSDHYKEWWDAAESIGSADLDNVFEFYLGMGLVDECLSAPADLLSGRVVLTGFGGDEIWAPLYAPSTDLVRDTSDGSSLGEFRLRVGFVHIPVPMLGFRGWPRLREIGLADAMRPWRVNHRWYDRPVPRRIAEEAGVPREMFGQVKHAAAMVAVNVRDFAPDLFRRQIARYEKAARTLDDTSAMQRAPALRLQRARRMRGVRSSDKAPAQAWLVRLAKGRLTGVAGTGVKVHDDWLFEGGWAATGTPRALSLSGIYLGSGAVWDGETLSLIAPSHTAEAVYTLEGAGSFTASNSLAFLLAAAGIDNFPIAEAAKPLASLMRGTANYEREIFAGPQGTIRRYMNAIIVHDPRHGSDERQQVPDLRFQTFEEYRDYLLCVIRQASETFGGSGMSVYLSRGYSSAACAALAAQLDPVATALCLDRTQSGTPDDGTATAAALGLKSVLLKRAEREKSDGKDRILREEFPNIFEFSVGLGLADECLKAPAELLAGRTVLTGFHGDRMWGPVAEPRRYLTRTDTTGASLGEFRVRAGFLHIPVPMLGFWAAPRLQEVSRSEAMDAWRLGSDYDRPIARRIAEEAGVQRELFGQQKQSAATAVASTRKLAPPLLKMLLARYRPAANLLHGPVARLRAGLARRFGRKPSAAPAPGPKSAAAPARRPDAAPPRTAL